jgi:hypothetical protein
MKDILKDMLILCIVAKKWNWLPYQHVIIALLNQIWFNEMIVKFGFNHMVCC